MSNLKCEVVKICAVGCNKNFITIKVNDKEFTFYTSNRGFYDYLKSLGVPTSQSLRKYK